jgi:hypothetical protein
MHKICNVNETQLIGIEAAQLTKELFYFLTNNSYFELVKTE